MIFTFQMALTIVVNLLCGHVLDVIDYRLFLTGATFGLGIVISIYAWASTSHAALLICSALQGIGYGAVGLGM